jgi:hypothetical protein
MTIFFVNGNGNHETKLMHVPEIGWQASWLWPQATMCSHFVL